MTTTTNETTAGYTIEHNGAQFAPTGRIEWQDRPAADRIDITAHNAAVDARYLAQWETRPAEFHAYVTDWGTKRGTVTTWNGSTIGHVVSIVKCRHNMSRSMLAIQVQGTNGANYYGRFAADNGNLIRLRKSTR